MDSADILSLLEQLDDEINDLENSLAPLLKPALSETASKLPLLDNAKLYVLVTYALESMIFCEFISFHMHPYVHPSNRLPAYLRLNGVKAREHQVFKELTRVKQYFDKIKNAETPVGNRENIRVDKQAAARFIKAGLASLFPYHGHSPARLSASVVIADISIRLVMTSMTYSEQNNRRRRGQDHILGLMNYRRNRRRQMRGRNPKPMTAVQTHLKSQNQSLQSRVRIFQWPLFLQRSGSWRRLPCRVIKTTQRHLLEPQGMVLH